MARADAEKNRAALVAVARDAFKRSPDATMQSIARQAGVGQGTLYRHFPTRESLLIAAYRDDVESVVAAAPTLLAAHDPVTALRLWLDRLAAYGKIKQGVAAAVEAATRAELSGTYYADVIAAIHQLLTAGRSTGTLRPDITPEELLLLTTFLWRRDGHPDTRVTHALDLLIDGLRPRQGGSDHRSVDSD